MNGINAFIISFCSSCILLGFLYILCPSGNMSKITKYIFCLCFVCCVLGAVINIPKQDISFVTEKENNQVLTEQSVSAIAQMIFGEALNSNNINFRKIEVTTNKLYDGSIVISRVAVFTSENNLKIEQILASDNYEVVVINE